MKIDFRSFRLKKTPIKEPQFPTGTRAYKSHQGKGKTLSMVYDSMKLFEEWDKSILFSNVQIKVNDEDKKRYHYFNTEKGLYEALRCQNGANGVIVIIDEAHLFFGKKKGISLDVITAISQQRKDRRKIFISSQIWEDLDISLRKQVPEIIDCNNIFNLIQINTVYRGHTLKWDKMESAYIAQKDYTYIFKHNDRLYNLYNTYQKIINNEDYTRLPTNTNNINMGNIEVKLKKT